MLWLDGPAERGGNCDPVEVTGPQVAGETGEQLAFLPQLVAKRAAQRQIVFHRTIQRGHRCAPGHGATTRPSAARSTLA